MVEAINKKNRNTLWIIDALTVIFIVIQVQSTISYCKTWQHWYHPLAAYKIDGWADVLHNCFGFVVPWSKFLLFCANVYAVIRKAMGIAKKSIPSRLAVLIILNLIFIVLKLIEFYFEWEAMIGI